MSFQKCPVCEGSGINPKLGLEGLIKFEVDCQTCYGFGIISSETGLPPTTPPKKTWAERIEEMREKQKQEKK